MLPYLALGLLFIFILGLPPFGQLLTGYPHPAHLTIFPIPTEPGESSISWAVWGIVAIFIAGVLSPFIWRLFHSPVATDNERSSLQPFPRWGWIALLWLAGAWIVAWNRFSWFESFQPHTFPLLWFGFIVTLNALTYQRSGQCFLTHHPRFFAQMFLLSAGFWWVFEYLNQFVHNWHYVNLQDITPIEYFIFTSISFSTVLPAVLSTYEWLTTFPLLTQPFGNWHSISGMTNPKTGWILLSIGSLGLGLIGILPSLLFPFLWLCPLCLLLGMQIIRKDTTCCHGLAQGDWRPVLLSSLAALVCGFWWELWNAYSLVHWRYTLPYVHAFKFFEMPILGYTGYLPFGVLCVLVTEVVLGYPTNHLSRMALQGSKHH